jgi:hypothetical protein
MSKRLAQSTAKPMELMVMATSRAAMTFNPASFRSWQLPLANIPHSRRLFLVRLQSTYGFLGVPELTLQVSRSTLLGTAVHLTAAASGINPVSQIQIWLNGKEIYHVAGQTLDTSLNLPAGSTDRLVVQAIDSKGVAAKVVNTIAVN